MSCMYDNNVHGLRSSVDSKRHLKFQNPIFIWNNDKKKKLSLRRTAVLYIIIRVGVGGAHHTPHSLIIHRISPKLETRSKTSPGFCDTCVPGATVNNERAPTRYADRALDSRAGGPLFVLRASPVSRLLQRQPNKRSGLVTGRLRTARTQRAL